MIDIIIPAYNSNKFIDKCLFSICMQTIKEKINVYIIDDFSNKTYDDIVNKFKNLINIELIRLNKNRGPGFARQVGLDNSNGKYILFLDSDDYFYDCYSVENLYNIANHKDNVIVYGYVLIENKDKSYDRINNEGSLHGKLFCRKVIEKNKLKFYEAYNHEDLSFYLLYNSADIKKLYCEYNIYFYRYNKKSITRLNESKYYFNKSKEYVENIIWYVENSEQRKFNMTLIAENIYYALVILYNRYIENYYEENSDFILNISKKILDLYRKYKNYLNDEIEYELYDSINKKYIPIITINDFFKKIDNYKNNLKNELISIIVPIYNKEKYIEKTIKSILNQTYKNIELILIDDCSKDKSVEICKKFQKKDKRIKLILNNKNLGVSKTRNIGIENSLGEYIGFVDADDTIKKEMYEKLYNYVKKYDLDFVQCNNIESDIHLEKNFKIVDGNENIISLYLSDDKITDTVWSKLFKKEIIKNVKFNENYRKHEDTLLIFDILKRCNKICLINEELYYYNNIKTSLTNTKKFEDEIKLLEIVDNVEEFITKKYNYMMLLFYWYKLAKLLYFFEIIKKVKQDKNEKNKLKKIIEKTQKFINDAPKIDYQNLKKYNQLNKMIERYK